MSAMSPSCPFSHATSTESRAQPAVQRLSKRLFTLSKSEHLEVTMGVVTDTVTAGTGTLSERQKDALHDVKRAFHVT